MGVWKMKGAQWAASLGSQEVARQNGKRSIAETCAWVMGSTTVSSGNPGGGSLSLSHLSLEKTAVRTHGTEECTVSGMRQGSGDLGRGSRENMDCWWGKLLQILAVLHLLQELQFLHLQNWNNDLRLPGEHQLQSAFTSLTYRQSSHLNLILLPHQGEGGGGERIRVEGKELHSVIQLGDPRQLLRKDGVWASQTEKGHHRQENVG